MRPVVLAEREAPDGRLEDDDPRDDHPAGERPRERGDDRDEDVDGRRERPVEPPFVPEQRRVESDREERADLDVHPEAAPRRSRAASPGAAKTSRSAPHDERRHLADPERRHRAARHDERAESDGEDQPVPAPEGATEEQRASHERVHRAFFRYQLGSRRGQIRGWP